MQKNDLEPFVSKVLNKMRQIIHPKQKEKFFKEDPEININSQKWYLASFNKRLLAATIDAILISILIIPLSQIIPTFGIGDKMMKIQMNPELMLNDVDGLTVIEMLYKGGVLTHLILMQLSFFLLSGMTIVWFWYKKGSTPGKMLFKCKIVSAETYEKISLKQCIVRFLSLPLSIFSLMIGLFMIEFTKNRQSLHDKIAKTIVVYEKK